MPLRPLVLAGAFSLGAALHAAPAPNIIFILCDDLGFGDTGPSFQNSRAAKQDRSVPAFATPQLDRFVAEGAQLRNHYCAAPVCAPSRASLLLGQTQGHANVRDNQFDKALANNHTIATVLKEAGYATAAIGKWGLQGRAGGQAAAAATTEEGSEAPGGNPAKWPAYPTKRGFDFYYGYVRHGDGHFHYPKEDKREVWENDKEVSAGLDRCYTTDLFTARAKKWIVEHRAAHAAQPFFLYLAYDTPHAKLQLPPAPYPAGAGLKGGVQWLGKSGAMINAATGTVDGWMDPALAAATWDHDKNPATPEVPWPDVQRRYVAGVQRIDHAVGDLLRLLKDLGVDDSTLIVFTSDNGPSKESYLKEAYDPTFFSGYGAFDGIKRDTLEGGVREPAFVRWPSRIPAGRVDRTPSGMWDWLATFAEAAGVTAPATSDGVSLIPALTGRGTQRPSTLYIEYFNNAKTPPYTEFAAAHRGRVRQQMQTVQVDGLVGVRYNIKSAGDDFEIFDVEKDPAQTRNLAGEPGLADVQAKMKARVLQVRRPDAGAKRPYDSAAVPAATAPANLAEGRLEVATYEGEWPWVPDFSTLTPTARSTVRTIDAAACPPKDGVGAVFSGWFRATSEGDYRFHVASDGGAALFLHEARVIDDDFARTGAEASGTIRLAAGWHPIRLYYRHATGTHSVAVEFTPPAGQRQKLAGAAIGAAK